MEVHLYKLGPDAHVEYVEGICQKSLHAPLEILVFAVTELSHQ